MKIFQQEIINRTYCGGRHSLRLSLWRSTRNFGHENSNLFVTALAAVDGASPLDRRILGPIITAGSDPDSCGCTSALAVHRLSQLAAVIPLRSSGHVRKICLRRDLKLPNRIDKSTSTIPVSDETSHSSFIIDYSL
jgi:hypothetical protein